MAEDDSEADPMNLLPAESPTPLPNSLDGNTQLTSIRGDSEPQTTNTSTPVTKPQPAKKVKTRTRHHMVYGFVWTNEDLLQWSVQRYGPVDSGRGNIGDYFARAFMNLADEASEIWSRTEVHPVASETDRYVRDYCLALAENTSKDAMTTPPQEVIDNLKVALGVTQEPKWRVVRGSY